MNEPYGHQSEQLDRHAWRIWVSIVTVAVVTTVGLGAVVILGNAKVQSLWPWAYTDYALLAALGLVVLSFAWYLTRQQMHLLSTRRQLLADKQAADENLNRHVEQLEAVLNISRTMAATNDDQAVYDSIVEGCFGVFDCDNASLMLLDHATHELVVRAATGHADPSLVLGARIAWGQGVAGRVAEARRPMILDGKLDPAGFEGFSTKFKAPAASMVVPITLRGEVLGVIAVANYKNNPFRDEDLEAMAVFSEHAGLCCRHTEQTRWMRETIQRLDSELDNRNDKAA